ncbi:MAG: hypothetical protein ACXW29_10700, partial [Thermoanaerobaculia bacterium]
MNKTHWTWIAVALATAIRLFAPEGRGTILVAAIVAIAGIAAMALAAERTLRVAGLFLIVVATADVAAWLAARRLDSLFPSRSAQHLGQDAVHVRQQIGKIEAELDAGAARIATRVADVKPGQRIVLFTALRNIIGAQEGRGARVLDASGVPVAWWGEDLRTAGGRSFEFDATNVYLIRSRSAGPYTLQVFERIPNHPGEESSPMHHVDAWVESVMFHGGFLERDADARRFLVEKRSDSALYVDLQPRPRAEVVGSARAQGRTAAAILLAIGALTVLALLRLDHTGSAGRAL